MPDVSSASRAPEASSIAAEGLWDLYLRLSKWLIPSFILCALAGLSLLSHFTVQDVEERLSMRVGNLAARVAVGLEQVALGPEDAVRNAKPVMLTLLSDPAIQCAELRDLQGDPMLRAPEGLGCEGISEGLELVIPTYFTSDADLVVRWTRDEALVARQRQRELSMAILAVGLVIALITNWLAFRTIIGKPLRILAERVEQAKTDAEHNALHDSLTGLANRRCLEQDLRRRCGDGGTLTVLHVDLDGFKAVNDAHGHAAGDKVLQTIAGRLMAVADDGDLVTRQGGDEFLILCGGSNAPMDAARALGARIIEEATTEIWLGEDACRVGASVGIATGTLDGRYVQAAQIVANSDVALYQAKAQGKGTSVVFAPAMRARLDARRQLAEDVRQALETGAIIPHYQPQVCTRTGRIAGIEALARWQHPTEGLLGPNRFIPAAEELGLVDQIDRRIMYCALEDMERLSQTGWNVPRVSVNVSARRLYSTRLMDELREMDVPGSRLSFEVLETVMIDSTDPTLRWNLDGLRELGIELEVDDFGTGRASINSVLALKPSRIKVAREIIHACDAAGPGSALLQATVALGRAVGVHLVAEGVETEEQIALVSELGFDCIQGFAIVKPMSAAALEEWIETRTRRRDDGQRLLASG